MAMVLASNMPLNHFTDPHHPLHETPQYSHDQAGNCSICLLGLAGHRGRGCNFCNIHLHAACAGYFQETITFFAHPLHALRLIRSPGRLCDICDRDCPPGSFVYSCIGCGFDVHALCTMLPERVANPYHPGHELRMVFSLHGSGSCSACHQQLPVWRYSCSPGEELHIACAVNPPTATPASGSMGSYAQSIHHGAVGQRSFGGDTWSSTGDAPVTPGRVMTAIAKFLVRAALSAAVSELVNELLSGGFN